MSTATNAATTVAEVKIEAALIDYLDKALSLAHLTAIGLGYTDMIEMNRVFVVKAGDRLVDLTLGHPFVANGYRWQFGLFGLRCLGRPTPA
jgi:hypothetical protein